MDKISPTKVSEALVRIAHNIDGNRTPSHSAIAGEIGKVLIALGEVESDGGETNPEGDLAVPDGQLIAHLQKWLGAKYTIDVAYRNFADRIRGPWRDSLVDHWYEHAKEERSHTYDLTMKLVALGADPAATIIQVPQCTANVESFIMTLAKMEKEAIQAGREAIKMAGDRTSLKVMAENFVLVDTQHLDDLRRMTPPTATTR